MELSDIALGLLDGLGAWAVVEYRFRRAVRALPRPARLVLRPVTMVTRKLMEIVTGISVSTDAEIGPGFLIVHFGGVFVGPGVVAGSNFTLSQGVTVGIEKGASPRFGDFVYLAPGAKVFGPVTMGDRLGGGRQRRRHARRGAGRDGRRGARPADRDPRREPVLADCVTLP